MPGWKGESCYQKCTVIGCSVPILVRCGIALSALLGFCTKLEMIRSGTNNLFQILSIARTMKTAFPTVGLLS